ncbi:CRAL-TRIO domain-containing protein [Amylocystis lapponica]|nr:CRAL-TRIO domain-containing protein [Amylocystis lapponica]
MAGADAEVIYEAPPPPRIPEKQPPPELTLTPDHQKLFDEVLAHFANEAFLIPGTEDGALREEEKFWLSYECILRYLRATKWTGASAAIKRIEETLVWRREYGLYDLITAEHVEPEALTGKQFTFGYDVDGRPACYMRPSRQNTDESPRQLHLLVWILERHIELMGPGVETLALMVDFADRTKSPSLAQSRATLNILQNHYPERLGRALIAHLPFFINAFFKMVMPFVDPVSRAKMRFNPAPVKEGLFVPEQLVSEWGGDCRFEYEHERYWPALVRMCTERKEQMKTAWREQGAKVGLREWDVKCAAEKAENVAGNLPVVASSEDSVEEKAPERLAVIEEVQEKEVMDGAQKAIEVIA